MSPADTNLEISAVNPIFQLCQCYEPSTLYTTVFKAVGLLAEINIIQYQSLILNAFNPIIYKNLLTE